MRKFAVVVFECNCHEIESFATIWISISCDENLKVSVPLNMEETFRSLGMMKWDQAEKVAAAMKALFFQLEIECFEHTISDD